MTQNDKILEYLQTGHTITPMQALDKFGCFRLAARIQELKMRGHNIQATPIVVGRHKARIARYRLIK